MMDENAATVPNFVTILLDYANGSLKRAVDGLTDEQVYHQPTEETNNIAWLAWHMNRWKDWQGSLVSGEEQVWIRDGWCDKFGIPAERTGIGDTTEQVAEFRPPLDLLWALHRGRAHHLHRAGQRPLDGGAGGDGALHARPRRTEAQVALHPRRLLGHHEAHRPDRVPAGPDHRKGLVWGVGGAR